MTKIDILDREIRWTDDLCVAEWIDDAKAEIQQLRDRHGMLSKMLGEAAQIIDDQTEEIGELQSDLEMFMSLCDKKDEWLEAQRKEIADLKQEIQNEYDLTAYKSSCWEP